jgi:hypothetical protein
MRRAFGYTDLYEDGGGSGGADEISLGEQRRVKKASETDCDNSG